MTLGWAAAPELSAASREFYFEWLSGERGLSQNTVHDLLQDRDGFVWIATQGGLHRYDGQRFRVFTQDPDAPDGLPDSYVSALAQGEDGLLWVGSNSGYVVRMDPRSEKVLPLPADLTDGLDQYDKRVLALLAADDLLWVATAAGVHQLDLVQGERRTVLTLRRGDFARALARDPDGSLWIGTDAGLYRLPPGATQAEAMPAPDRINALHLDRRGRLWLGGANGLHLYDGGRREALVVWPSPGDGTTRREISTLAEDPAGRLWLGLKVGGLRRYDIDRQRMITVNEVAGLPATLPEDSITRLMVDRSGMLWVGGQLRGVSITDPDGARFRYVLDLGDGTSSWIHRNSVRALYQDDDGHLWIGLDAYGLRRYAPQSGRIEDLTAVLLTAFDQAPDPSELRTIGIAAAGGGQLWLATNLGLLRLDPATRRVERAAIELPSQNLRRLYVDAHGRLWIGSSDAGVFRLDPHDGTVVHFPYHDGDGDSLSHPLVEPILEDRRGRIWVGTNHGLNLLDPETGRVTRFLHDPQDHDSLAGNRVRALHQGADGSLWIGTHSGLSRLIEDAHGFRFERHTRIEPDDPRVLTVFGILESGDAMLWLSTSDGILRFDPRNGQFRRYGLRDGLQDLEFNGGAQLQLTDGRLAFGGIRGLNLFDPTRMRDSDFSPPLVLLGVRIGTDTLEAVGLHAREGLSLPQGARTLRLHYGALDFAAPGQLQYRYRMDGFDRDWIAAGTTQEASYTNLGAGGYVFRVQGTNRDGVWSEHELAVPIDVVPPWWASRPVQVLYGLLIALAAYSGWRIVHRRRQQERALLAEISEREERLKLALWGSGDEFWDWDISGDTLFRVGTEHVAGSTSDHTPDLWRDQPIHPDDIQRVQSTLQEHILGRTEFFESEHRVRRADGQWIWVRARGKVVRRDAQGNPLRMAGTARDITASRRAERERRIAIEVLRSMSEAVAVVDLDFRFVSVNPAFSRITGYTEEEVVGQSSRLLDSTQHSADFYRRMREVIERTGHWAGEMWQRRKDGEEFLGWIEISEVCDEQGLRTHFVAVVNDITDKKRAEQELRYLANYDTLTGLPNRALLSERLARAIVRARRQDTRVAVLFLDLDRFKDINDSLGHAAGDRILKAAAARLLATVGASDTVARLGGDEFTVVLEDVEHLDAVERTARDILAAFAEPLEIDERHDVTISPSIGISLYPDHGLVPTDLLKFADTAMYQAKGVGRNTFQLYTEAMDAETRRRATMAAALRKALDRGELRLLFQPRLSLIDGRITGVEALLRWHSAELGEISPVSFIPLAEETGLILPIGEWVLREACMTLKRWRHNGLTDIAMAVNVSVLQLLRGNLPEALTNVLTETQVPAEKVELEVTESMVMANAEQTTAVLHELRRLGVSIAIDDFGTGYSSLVYLKRLPIDTLKIDKEFVGDLTRDPDDEAITATVITMAHSLGLNVIAEGVETQQQMDYLREQGCDEIQGYWLSPPLDAHHCLAFMRTWQPTSGSVAASQAPAGLPY